MTSLTVFARALQAIRVRAFTLCALFALASLAVATLSTAVARAQQQPQPAAAGADARSADARRLDAALEEAWKINQATDPAKAQAAFERIRVEAERLGLTRQQARALRGLGSVDSSQERNVAAKALMERALELSRQAGDELGEARATRQLGAIQGTLGDHAEGMRLLTRARDTFARLGERYDLALTYYNMVYEVDDLEERKQLLPEALAAAKASGVRWIECTILHAYGDSQFTHGRYAAAFQTLTQALSCYEGTDRIANKGRVLVSLGRVERAHGQYQRALAFYERAYALQQQVHDEPAAIQSLNAIGVAYGYLGRFEEARQKYEEALTRSRALGSERYIAFLLGNVGNAYVELGQYDKGLDLLQQSLALEKGTSNRAHRYLQISGTLRQLNRMDEALAAVEQGVALAGTDTDLRVRALAARAQITQRMNRLDASDADLREALALIEDIRHKTLAQDFMKRGFCESTQEVFDAAVDVRSQRGDARGALEVAEQARARAFLDLLASRRTAPAVVGMVANAHTTPSPTNLPAGGVDKTSTGSVPVGAFVSAPLGSRGAGTEAVAPYLPNRQALDIESARTVDAPTTKEIIATATRLHSTLLVYWVGPRATIAWVITPAGRISSVTINVESTRLAELARSTTAVLKSGNAAALTLLGASQTKPWRELYQLLIKPVRGHLPTTPGSLLTIVPHGPLFQVSFAALQDEQGRYLIESYRLHYTPSVGVLTYTARSRHRAVEAHARALLVGDPMPPASDPGDEQLSELPWARREVTEIGSILGPRRARVITERDATEARVREEIERADLLHFATHGIIRQSASMSSFLALTRRDDDRSSAAATTLDTAESFSDGKLTADEVYGLRLRADLVVLSACGTALGPMSGDGVIGFTRAFLYAGARSVIATEWNVPDQTGYEVMRRFYRFRKLSNHTSEALRDAQIAVLSSLRKGTLRVGAQGAAVALRENPLFWAGFVLVGQP